MENSGEYATGAPKGYTSDLCDFFIDFEWVTGHQPIRGRTAPSDRKRSAMYLRD
jgi:hypothetical protein